MQPHELPLMQRLTGAIFQQDNAQPHTTRVSQDCLCTVTTLPWPSRSPIPRFVSNRAYLGSFGTESRASHEFERTRGKVTANMERNVSSYRTCMPQCPIVSHRAFVLEGVQQGIKSSVLLPFSVK
ncbi:uncharacterized protein TNCV_2484661 [Trichonephila clavipes]|uniref:Uncharacterized protein n=1 Tax=Trichonephila clavipes TaxID=2585209 RepID=A0A8X6VZZ6_TRICX|nr:uncharacterized protein TNCV_2484661 [Trichonephila clavipes]